jgi:hypothetical protein
MAWTVKENQGPKNLRQGGGRLKGKRAPSGNFAVESGESPARVENNFCILNNLTEYEFPSLPMN